MTASSSDEQILATSDV